MTFKQAKTVSVLNGAFMNVKTPKQFTNIDKKYSSKINLENVWMTIKILEITQPLTWEKG